MDEARGAGAEPMVFDDVFRAHFSGVAKAAAFVARDAGTGQELAQEAFARLFHRWQDIASEDQARNFAYRVAINLARSHVRKHLRVSLSGWGRELGTVPDPAESASAWVTAVAALGVLSPRQRACVVLADYVGLDSDEIGTALGMRAGTVRVHLTRGRRSLHQVLHETAEVER
ncbi:MAG: RNA polymerase sigma factor [Actinomycetota bacterium]